MEVLLGQVAGSESGRRNFDGHCSRCRRKAFQADITLARLLRAGVPAKGRLGGWTGVRLKQIKKEHRPRPTCDYLFTLNAAPNEVVRVVEEHLRQWPVNRVGPVPRC